MSTRQRILSRDGFKCQCCGRIGANHEVDHRTPLEQGGSNDDSNLWLLCHDCHARKTADEAKERQIDK
jgi:5-methylcytosine-specific restriction protein A